MVMCKQPHYAVDEVTFNTYPSLKALYAAYEARAAALSGAPFRANTGNCTERRRQRRDRLEPRLQRPTSTRSACSPRA